MVERMSAAAKKIVLRMVGSSWVTKLPARPRRVNRARRYLSAVRALALFPVGIVLAACATRGAVTAPAAAPSTSAVRVVRGSDDRAITFGEFAGAAATADVVFFGEQHDDPETHFAEFALLEAIGRRRNNVVLSLEMFERDVQRSLDDYLAGRVSEKEFLAASRPWDRYATDYRALVVLARSRGWPVIAANVPRPIASAVSRKGLSALDTLPVTSRDWVAREIICPKDHYSERFAEQMKDHGSGGPASAADLATMRAMTDRFYEAQCIKDETMAESIARAYERAGKDAIVVHFNGAFHSDYAEGTASRVKRRLPSTHHVVVTAVPVEDPRAAAAADRRGVADYVLLTRKP
jgi:uncharacterized iron-regulated protein